jgi:hypothetical protein
MKVHLRASATVARVSSLKSQRQAAFDQPMPLADLEHGIGGNGAVVVPLPKRTQLFLEHVNREQADAPGSCRALHDRRRDYSFASGRPGLHSSSQHDALQLRLLTLRAYHTSLTTLCVLGCGKRCV